MNSYYSYFLFLIFQVDYIFRWRTHDQLFQLFIVSHGCILMHFMDLGILCEFGGHYSQWTSFEIDDLENMNDREGKYR